MGKLTIVSNYQPRPLLYWWELTSKEQSEFDWIKDNEHDQFEFFRYKGNVHCMADYMRIDGHNDDDFSAWDGYHGDSYFSGTLVKYPYDEFCGHDYDYVIVGWYYC